MRTSASSSVVATTDGSDPAQTAPRASTPSRSLNWDRSEAVSSGLLECSVIMSGLRDARATLAEFANELGGGDVKGVLLEEAADDDHGVGAHHVHHDVS